MRFLRWGRGRVMGLTKNLRRTGRAASTELREQREALQEQIEASILKKQLEKEKILMNDCYFLEGETFIEWYESDAVPNHGSTLYRIELIKARIQEQITTIKQDTDFLLKTYRRKSELENALLEEPMSKEGWLTVSEEIQEIEDLFAKISFDPEKDLVLDFPF